MSEMMTIEYYVCVNGEWDPQGCSYSDAGEFYAMCEAVFGEAPTLRKTANGDYVDAVGTLILQRREA